MYLKNFLIGIIMGICDLIPGVSGGTIALISGIYETLISSIKSSLDIKTFILFFSGKRKLFWERINGFFLISLFGGIFLSILVASRFLENALENTPELVRGFFFGLVIASIILLIQKQEKRGKKQIFGLFLGILGAILITTMTPTEIIPTYITIIFSASIAISAMILPGISGSFLLVILGMYKHVLTAVNEKDFIFLGLFIIGALLGLAIFSRILTYVLHRYKITTMAVLIGTMIGAIYILWPWQNNLESVIIDGKEIVSKSEFVLPKNYNKNPNSGGVLILFFIGLIGGYKSFEQLNRVNK